MRRLAFAIGVGLAACGGDERAGGPGRVGSGDDAAAGASGMAGQPDSGAAGKGGGTGASGSDAQPDGSSSGGAPPDAPAPDDAAQSDADTCASQVGGNFNCCDSAACRGYCVSVGCACGAVVGGCPRPLICCSGYCRGEDGC